MSKQVFIMHNADFVPGFPQSTPFPGNSRVVVDWDAMTAEVQPLYAPKDAAEATPGQNAPPQNVEATQQDAPPPEQAQPAEVQHEQFA